MKQNLLINPLSDGITIKNFEAELDKEINFLRRILISF